MKTASVPEMQGRELLASGFTTALRLARTCAEVLSGSEHGKGNGKGGVAALLLATLTVIDTLAGATAYSAEDVVLRWHPDEWADAFVKCLRGGKAGTETWKLHKAMIMALLTLGGTPTIRPGLKRGRRSLVEPLTSKVSCTFPLSASCDWRLTNVASQLLDYLQPPCAPCFVEAVQLMWGVERLSDSRHVESMIADRLASADAAIRLPAFEAFGNLWRFTGSSSFCLACSQKKCHSSLPLSEDAQLPGVVLRTPMFMMLDSLKAEDLSTRRAGEAWMRCSLKSYLRHVLESLSIVFWSDSNAPR